MYKYQQLIIYGYSIPYSEYDSYIKGTQFYKQYIPLEFSPSKGDLILLPDMSGKEYCLLGIVQFATEKSDIIEPITPPQKIQPPQQDKLNELQETAEQAPIKLNSPDHYIVTHSD